MNKAMKPGFFGALVAASKPEGVVATMTGSRPHWLSLRRSDITASVAACLYGDGAHPYMTALQLYHEKRREDHQDDDSPTKRRGRLLEPVILAILREDYPDWLFEPCRFYYSDPLARIGATPDFFAWRPDRAGFGVINGKTVGKYAYRKGWQDSDGDVALPLWVAIQVTVEAALCGASWGAAAPLRIGDGGLDLDLIEIPLEPAVMPSLRKKVSKFWRRVADDDPYPPDWNRDAALVTRLYDPDADRPMLDLGDDPQVADWLDQRESLKTYERDGSEATKRRKLIDAKLTDRLGNAPGARLADGRFYSVSIVKKQAYTVPPQQYPVLKTGGCNNAGARNRGDGSQSAAGFADDTF